jgi:exodeoxyribonuclease III
MTLRILSYNILVGGEERLPLIARVIQRQQPDAVALLEANSQSNVEALAQQLGMEVAFGKANSVFHIAWLSRFPILRTENHRLPILEKTLLEIDLHWDGTELALFATHLRAGRLQEYDHYRALEMQAILGLLRSLDHQPHVLVGDLNTVHPADNPNFPMDVAPSVGVGKEKQNMPVFPRQVIPFLLEAGYIDCYHTLHPVTPGYTYPVPDPWLRIDYIFAAPTLAGRLQACDVATGADAEMASDHFPVWAEFRQETSIENLHL